MKRQTSSRRRPPAPLVGAHISIAGGTPLAISRAREVGANVMQIFVKNNNQWQGKTITDEEAVEFRESRARSKIRAAVAHNSYLINLASPDRNLWDISVRAMLDELTRCERLGLSHLVSHPGAHVGSGEARGISRVAAALDRIFEEKPDCPVKVALETTAGQGTCLGHRFAHLRDILARCEARSRVSICLDTCHVFAAGYDFRSDQGYDQMMGEFDSLVGLERLEVLHFNDSKRELGSRVDRHEHIGRGEIGAAGFTRLLHDPRLAGIPKILETPKGKDSTADRRNLRLLKRLYRSREVTADL